MYFRKNKQKKQAYDNQSLHKYTTINQNVV